MNKSVLVSIIVCATVTLLNVIGIMLTLASSFFAGLFISVVFLGISIARLKKTVNKVSTIVLLTLLIFSNAFNLSFPPLAISSNLPWQYPFQRHFIGLYNNVKEPECFPDFNTAEINTDLRYDFDYQAGILQGAGFYSVYFNTTPERAAEYEKEFSKEAKYIIDGNNYSERYRLSETDTILVYLDWSFEVTGNCTIYVLETNLSENHPKTTAFIVNSEKGTVQFSQLG